MAFRSSFRKSAWTALALWGAFGCSAGTLEPPPTVVSSQSGALRVELFSPDGVMRGLNRFQFSVLDVAAAMPADELELRVQPFMPAMGHGTGATPTVEAAGAGRYEFSGVLLNMAGRWQLRTTITGARSDYVVFDVDVP